MLDPDLIKQSHKILSFKLKLVPNASINSLVKAGVIQWVDQEDKLCSAPDFGFAMLSMHPIKWLSQFAVKFPVTGDIMRHYGEGTSHKFAKNAAYRKLARDLSRCTSSPLRRLAALI